MTKPETDIMVSNDQEWNSLFTFWPAPKCLVCGRTEVTGKSGPMYSPIGFWGSHHNCMQLYVILRAMDELS